MSTVLVLPQFPLQVVLFPTMILPLHIFEPRYRSLVADIIDGDRKFGVVMIEKGLDTGGDDQRSNFGTVAEIADAEQLDDGRWAIIAVGVERFKVSEWLPDDPYPQASIELWPDANDAAEIDPDGPCVPEIEEVTQKFQRCVALASEAGVNIGEIPGDFTSDLSAATMQMSAILPVGPFDKQRLLGAGSAPERLQLLDSLIVETLEIIDLQLRGR